MRRRDKITIWPIYLDTSKTRNEGRRLSKDLGVNSPKLSELFEAAKELKLEPELVPEAAYPRIWWDKTGYLLVNKTNKSKLLVDLASKISNLRLRVPKQKKRKK